VTRARPWTLAAAIAALLACGAPLRKDELDCEEAVAHLADCCPGFVSSALACRYEDHGCGGVTHPALDIGEAACIRDERCAQLVSDRVCARAQQARAYTTGGEDAGSPPPARGTVCP
jgi:hypothetical protein